MEGDHGSAGVGFISGPECDLFATVRSTSPSASLDYQAGFGLDGPCSRVMNRAEDCADHLAGTVGDSGAAGNSAGLRAC